MNIAPAPVSTPGQVQNPLVIRSAGGEYGRQVLDTRTTTDATPTVVWSRALAPGKHCQISVSWVAHDNSGNQLAGAKTHNAVAQSAGGTSKRVTPTSAGSTDTSGNDFSAAGGGKPTVTFGDPSGTGISTVIITGKSGLTIQWNMTVEWNEGT